jgi:hypothetical protein
MQRKTFTFLIAAFFLLVSQFPAASKDVSFKANAPNDAWTDLEDGARKNLHVRRCLYSVTVDGSRMGNICARLKSTKSGAKQWDAIIFETRNSSIKFKTTSRDGDGNSKFWLKDSGDDTSNFNSFLNKFTDTEQAVLGTFCKRIADKEYLSDTNKNILKNGSRIVRSELKSINLAERNRDLVRVAKRCYKAVERKIGEIKFVSASGTKSVVAANSSQWKNASEICGVPASLPNYFTSSRIRRIQYGLKKRGLYSGSIDGVMGKVSCTGFAAFMKCEAARSSTFTMDDFLFIKGGSSKNARDCYNPEPACKMPKFQIKVAQKRLQELGIYKSKIDGQRGPGTIKAIKEVEGILASFSDTASGCLSDDESLWLSALVYGKNKNAICNILNTPEELLRISGGLSKLGYGSSYALQSPENLRTRKAITIVKSIIDYEEQVDDGYFRMTSIKRDCRLVPYEMNTVSDLLKPRPTMLYSLLGAKHFLSDLGHYLENCENYFGVALAGKAAPVTKLSHQQSWNKDDKKRFDELVTFVKETKSPTSISCKTDQLANIKDFNSFHKARSDNRSKAFEFANTVLENEINVLIKDVKAFMVQNVLDQRVLRVKVLESKLLGANLDAGDDEIQTKLALIRDARSELETLEIAHNVNKIDLIDTTFLLNQEQLDLANEIAVLNEEIQTNVQLEKLASAAVEVAKIEERNQKEDLLRQEALTLFDDIREYYNSGATLGLDLARFLATSKGAELSNEWTAELTNNFEQLLTYVNKYDEFKTFRNSRSESRRARENQAREQLIVDINRILEEIEAWVRANPFAEDASILLDLVARFGEQSGSKKIAELEANLSSLLEDVSQLSIQLPISELIERRGYSLDGDNAPVVGAQNVIIKLAEAQQYILDLQAFVNDNSGAFGLQLVKLYTSIVPIVEDDAWGEEMKESFATLQDFANKNEPFVQYRYALVEQRDAEKASLNAILQGQISCLINTGEAYSKENLFATQTVQVLDLLDFANRLQISEETNDKLRLILQMQEKYIELKIESECLVELNLELLRLPQNDKLLIEKINAVKRSITSAELEIALAEETAKDAKAQAAADAAAIETNLVQEEADERVSRYQIDLDLAMVRSKILLLDISEYVNSGNQFPIEFVRKFSDVRGIMNMATWDIEKYETYLEFEKWCLAQDQFTTFVEARTKSDIEKLKQNLLAVNQNTRKIIQDFTNWASKNQLDTRAFQTLGAISEFEQCEQPAIIVSRNDTILVSKFRECVMKVASMLDPKIINDENLCYQHLGIGCAAVEPKLPSKNLEPLPPSGPRKIVIGYIKNLNSANYILDDLGAYFSQVADGNCMRNRGSILEMNKLRTSIQKANSVSDVSEQVIAFFNNHVLICSELTDFLNEQGKSRQEVRDDELIDKIEELGVLYNQLVSWVQKNPFSAEVVSGIDLLDKTDEFFATSPYSYDRDIAKIRDLNVGTSVFLNRVNGVQLEENNATEPKGQLQKWSNASDYIGARQKRFCEIIQNSEVELRLAMNTGNQLKQNLALRTRDEEIEAIIPDGGFSDWVAMVEKVFATEAGDAAFRVKLQCEVSFGTGSIAAIDGEHVWVAPAKPGSRIYEQLLGVNRGDFVLMEGKLLTFASEGITTTGNKFLTPMGIEATYGKQGTATDKPVNIPDYFIEIEYLSKL